MHPHELTSDGLFLGDLGSVRQSFEHGLLILAAHFDALQQLAKNLFVVCTLSYGRHDLGYLGFLDRFENGLSA